MTSPLPDFAATIRNESFIARAIAGLLVTLLASCATYPEQTAKALRDFRRGQFERAHAAYADPDSDSAFLSGVEAGTVALTAGDWAGAQLALHQAADAAAEIENRALLDPESLGEALSSWAFNDTARTYEGEGFERVYVHCGLAMTYLAQGFLDDVYVEARRANQLLEAEEQLYETSYQAGGWGHVVSGLAYELSGDYDQAYIDYLRMEEKGVGTEYAGPALVRLAKRLRRDEDLERWEEAYGSDPTTIEEPASIVVLAGVGLGPFKVEGKVTVFTRDGLVPVAGAAYQSRPQPISALRLTNGDLTAETSVIEDVSVVSAQSLKDRQVWSAAKSIARGLLKRELTKKLEDEHGGVGRLAGDLFAVFSERADLRCWLTLPDTWQAVRLFVPSGVQALTLEAVGGERIELGSFELDPGEMMIVFARSLGTRLYAHPIGGQLIGGSP